MDNKKPLGEAIEGGATVTDYDARIDAREDHIGFIVPIYVRAGAVVPTIELEQYVGERNAKGLPNPITLNIYPGRQEEDCSSRTCYAMYLDDGVSRSSAPPADPPYEGDDAARGEYRETHITHVMTRGTTTREIKVKREHDQYNPLEHFFFVAILHDPAEEKGSSGRPLQSISIERDGASREVLLVNGPADLDNSEVDAWYYNQGNNISFIKVFDNDPAITITAHYYYEPRWTNR
jgi:alpha-glucosidase